jgi:hypothetical protein
MAQHFSPDSHTPIAPGGDVDLAQRVMTAMFEIVDDFAPVITRQMHSRIPDLGSPDDQAATDATHRSVLGNIYELLCMSRAGLTDRRLVETSPEALEHLRFLKGRAVGMKPILGFYQIGFAMFEPVMNYELERVVRDPAMVRAMAAPMRTFIFTYVDQVTRRIAAEYGAEREGWVDDPTDPTWHDPASVDAAQRFIADLAARQRPHAPSDEAARNYTEAALARFVAAMEVAAEDKHLSSVLVRADTTVRVELADDPDLFVTLLLDREPIEVTDAQVPAEVELSIVSADLSRLYSPDFHLAMAIARGRVGYSGPVRKFLQVTPVVRHASLPAQLELDVIPAQAASPR